MDTPGTVENIKKTSKQAGEKHESVRKQEQWSSERACRDLQK